MNRRNSLVPMNEMKRRDSLSSHLPNRSLGKISKFIVMLLACMLVGGFLGLCYQEMMSPTYEGIESRRMLRSQMMADQTPHQRETRDHAHRLPPHDDLQKLSRKQLTDFFHGYVLGTQTLCSRRVRMGSIGDGGWDVCEDPQHTISPSNCLVYSFGISDDYSFDVGMQKYGCEVHAYDPSLGDYDPSKGQRFHFHKIGIGAKNINGTGKKWTIQTLERIRETNNHRPSQRRLDMVKMDVEGAELGSLMAALDQGSLRDVGQLVFEIHLKFLPVGDGHALVKDILLSYLTLLRRLWQEGFRLFHTKTNAWKGVQYYNVDQDKLQSLCFELHMVRVHPSTSWN